MTSVRRAIGWGVAWMAVVVFRYRSYCIRQWGMVCHRLNDVIHIRLAYALSYCMRMDSVPTHTHTHKVSEGIMFYNRIRSK